ncbi:MAG: hypothetical protein WDZ80_04655 [Candidatus Paceibacterota bacterium]
MKKKTDFMFWVVTITALTLVAVTGISYMILVYSGSFALSIGTFVLLLLLYVSEGFIVIPSKPPHKGVLVFLGERVGYTTKYLNEENEEVEKFENIFLNEGWAFLPFHGLIFDVQIENVERKPIKPDPIRTRTPDKADVSIEVELTVTPVPELLINYQNSGGLEGVKKQFFGEISERVREWAEGGEEGPSNWQELYQSKTEAASILIKRIAGKEALENAGYGKIPSYAQTVPTPVWLKFFSKERERGEIWLNEQFFQNELEWSGKEGTDDYGKWEKVWEKIDEFSDDEEEKEAMLSKLKTEIKKRRALIRNLQSGKGNLVIEDLGVKIERLNISNVEVHGKVKEAAEQQAKETAEKEAEVVENKHLQNIVGSWDGKEGRPKLSTEDALMVLQTERGKVTRNIDEKRISLDTRAEGVLPLINLFGGKKDG